MPSSESRCDEGVLKRRQPRHHRDDGIPQRLRQPVRRAHRPGQEVGGLDDLLDHRQALGAVAVEQPLVAVAVQDEVELPGQVPDVVQAGVHPLAAERAVDVRGVAGDEDPPDAQLRDVPVMDAEVAAPVQGARLDPRRRALLEDLAAPAPATARRLRLLGSSPRCGGGWRSSGRSPPGRIRSGTAAARRPAARRWSRRRPA